MEKTEALQKLLDGIASDEDIQLLNQLLASREISIGGNVNQSVIIIGSGNTVELSPAALDRLGARPLLGNLERDLTGEEIATGLARLESELPRRAPMLLDQFQEQARRLRPTLKTNPNALSESARKERFEALAYINSLCMEALDISFNTVALGEALPEYEARCPFRGLESFRVEDREFFFGREELTQNLVGKIKAHSFLAVLGASGSGKSSLVMAGMIPALDLDYAIIRPGTSPLEALDAARGKSLLVVDQFEELFTLTRDKKTCADFIFALLDAAATKSSKVIITLRSDFLGEAGAYRSLSTEIQNHLEIIPPMNADELRRAMEEQARWARLEFEADLSQQILDDVAGEPGAMPLLQHALWELWNRRHGRHLRANEYRAFGSVKRAIASTAEAVFARCTEFERKRLRDIFLRLTRLDEDADGRDTRRRVLLHDLIPANSDPAATTLLIKQLADARLVVVTGEEVEVAHEALIRHWERLRGWLKEDRSNLILWESVSSAARQWLQAGREETLLNHRGARLELAIAVSKNPSYGLSENEHLYLEACIRQRDLERAKQLEADQRLLEEQRQRAEVQAQAARRFRRFSVTLAGVLIFTFFALLLSLAFWRVSEARRLAALAQSRVTEGNPYFGAVLALQSLQIENTKEARTVLENVPLQTLVPARLYWQNSPVKDVAWSIDGRLALVTGEGQVVIKDLSGGTEDQLLDNIPEFVNGIAWSEDGRLALAANGAIFVCDSKGQVVQRISHTASHIAIAWSTDGRLASGTYEGKVLVWNLQAGIPEVLDGHTSMVNSLSWSPNGQLASGANDQTVIVWDLDRRKPSMTLRGHKNYVTGVAWSPDGQLASSSLDMMVIVWDVENKKPAKMLQGHTSAFTSLAWSKTGVLASAAWDGSTILWDVETGTVRIILREHTDWVNSLAWSQENKLASGSDDQSVIVWDWENRQPVAMLEGHGDEVESVAWSSTGQLASGSADTTIILWNFTSRKPQRILAGHSDSVDYLAWSPDGQLASGSRDKTILVWDPASGQITHRLSRHPNLPDAPENSWITGVAWSKEGQLASASQDGLLILWDLLQDTEAQSWQARSMIRSMSWTSGGEILTGLDDGSIVIWRPGQQEPVRTLEFAHAPVNSLAWSKQGLLAAATPDTIYIFDISGQKVLHTLRSSSLVSAMAWSPTGELATLSGKTITIWDASNGHVITWLGGYLGYDLAWSPAGQLAVGLDNLNVSIYPNEFTHAPCQWVLRNLTIEEWVDLVGIIHQYQPACPNIQPAPLKFPDIEAWKRIKTQSELIDLLVREGLLTLSGRLTILAASILLLSSLGYVIARFIRKGVIKSKKV